MEFLDIKRISTKEAKENLEQDKNIILLDVREDYEYKVCHIKEAKNVSVNKIEWEIDSLIEDTDATIYVYCHSGVRSVQACYILAELGYTNAYDLGGIMSWPYEVVVG